MLPEREGASYVAGAREELVKYPLNWIVFCKVHYFPVGILCLSETDPDYKI